MSRRLVRGAALVAAVLVMMATACVPDPPAPQTDTDGDRLADVVETGTGVYVGATDTGTDPAVADTDGDSISDGDEVLGTTAGLNLPAMGVSPLKKDLILEFDWFDDHAEPELCGAHSHRPSPEAIDVAADAFAAGPVSNPDGTTGVHLIADYGQGGAFTGGNLVADEDGVVAGGIDGDFRTIKEANFAANRNGYVHYVLNTHRFNLTSNSSGVAELNGDDLMISLRCNVVSNPVDFVANTIMHEVGHNLGLLHGGDSTLNYKPNYNSVMNYRFQFVGVDTDCDALGDGKLDFSAGVLPALDEFHLIEANGVCGPGGPGIDWNWNGFLDPETVPVSINGDVVGDVLTDHDDWSALDLGGIATGAATDGSQLRAQPEVIIEADLPV